MLHTFVCTFISLQKNYMLLIFITVPNTVGMVDITCDPVDFNNTCKVTWSVSNLIRVGICTIGITLV